MNFLNIDDKTLTELNLSEWNDKEKESIIQELNLRKLSFSDRDKVLLQLIFKKRGKFKTLKISTVSQEILIERLSICRKCIYWSENDKIVTGKCTKCNCPSSKLLQSSACCPDKPPKWLPKMK